MGETVAGNGFEQLGEWIKKLDRLAKLTAIRDLSNELSLECVALVGTGFEFERAASGQGWAKKRIPDGKPVGQKSGALRFAYRPIRVSSRGFLIGPKGKSRKYAGIFHKGRRAVHAKPGGVLRFQVGSRTYYRKSVGPAPARPLVPENGRLPHSWNMRLQQVSVRWFHKQIR
jgi:hypothetical protein